MFKPFVGPYVRQLRSERRFREDELAQILEASPSYLNQIEYDVHSTYCGCIAAHHRGVRGGRDLLRPSRRYPASNQAA